MPSDQTRNHVWRVAHQISLHSQQANRQVWRKNHSGSCALLVQICEATVGDFRTSKRAFCESIRSTNTTSISWRNTVSAMVQKKERHMMWHDTQCCGLPGMGEVAALQRHHPQSHSTFWMPCTVSTPGSTHQHHEIGWAGKNTSALIHTRLFLTHEGRVHGLTLTIVDDHPMTLTSTPSINQTHPLSLSFNPLSTCPGLRP